jgi:hypothetical protein
VQLTRSSRTDGSTTFSLRVRVAGSDERVPLGNTNEGWDEARAERARQQLPAKIELGLWSPRATSAGADYDEEPTFRELATDWFEARKANPALRTTAISGDRWALTAYNAARPGDAEMNAPAFPTRTGRRRDKDNVRERVIRRVVDRANGLRAGRDEPPILAHVTPHTLRRTYINFMLAAGFDLPYVQEQVGHRDPSTTLKIYAQVIRRPDRDQLRAETRALLGEDRPWFAPAPEPHLSAALPSPSRGRQTRVATEKAVNGRDREL